MDDDVSGRRFMISYAHQSDEHVKQVGEFSDFLRRRGFDVWLDQYATGDRIDWVSKTLDRMRSADHVLVVVSREYRRRFERTGPPEEGRGVQLESRLIREEFMRDQEAADRKFLPVVLPGCAVDDIPTLLSPYALSHYPVTDLTDAGCASLLRVLAGQPARTPPPLGTPPRPPAVVARLLVSGGSPFDRDEVARAFVAAAPGDPGDVVIELGPDGSVAGAVIATPAGDPDDRIGRGVKAVQVYLHTANAPLRARIAGHVPTAPGDDTVSLLADREHARALHRLPGAHVVVAASDPFHELAVVGVITYPRGAAYRRAPADGQSPYWLAVAGRTTLDEIPEPDSVDADTPVAAGAGVNQHVVVGRNNGVINTVAGDQVMHIGDVITYRGGPG